LALFKPLVIAIERTIGTLATFVACVLLVIEVALLFCGVVARYVFDAPIVWVGGLANFLFLWLSALGAVVALRRYEHMRLTGLVRPRGTHSARRLDLMHAALVLGVSWLLLLPAWAHVGLQAFITDPATGLSDQWRVLALPVAFGLFILHSVKQVITQATWTDLAVVILPVALAFVLVGLGGDYLAFLGAWNLALYFLFLLPVLVITGVPIAFAFILATLYYLTNVSGIPAMIAVGRMDAGMSDSILLAVPLFVFLGALIEITGVAKALVDFLLSLVGHLRGGISYVLIIGMYLVSGISGSKAADMAAVSPILRPAATARDEDPGEFVSLMSSSGAMAETIPPSLVLITVGSVTGVSISALFAGGLIPAALGAIALGLLCGWRARKHPVQVGEAASIKQRGTAFIVAIPALVLPLIIRAAVVGGVATATEVATVGIVYSLLVGLCIYRRFAWRRLYPALVETVSLSGAIMLIIGCATAMSWALTQSGVSSVLASAAQAVPGGSWGFLLVSILGFVVLGSFLEGIPAMVLFAPLLFPVAHSLGINTVHYAMVAILAMGIGLFAPPLGVGFYAACAIGKASPDRVMRRIWPYLGALLLVVIIVAAVPWFSTALL
jgi:tripartite ATP-independent transporter DctM subunit